MPDRSLTIGILALQGAFDAHARMLQSLGAKTLLIRKPVRRALVSGVVSGTQLIAYAVGGALAIVLAPRTIFVGAGVLGLLAPLLLGRALLRAARPPVLASAVLVCGDVTG